MSLIISFACSIESFTPPNMMYSNDSRRWWLQSYPRSSSTMLSIGMARSAGMSCMRCSWNGECMLIATWQSLSSRKRLSFVFTPTLLTVTRLGLHA